MRFHTTYPFRLQVTGSEDSSDDASLISATELGITIYWVRSERRWGTVGVRYGGAVEASVQVKGGCNRGIHMMVANYLQKPTQRYVPVDGLVCLWCVIAFRGVGGVGEGAATEPALGCFRTGTGRDGRLD